MGHQGPVAEARGPVIQSFSTARCFDTAGCEIPAWSVGGHSLLPVADQALEDRAARRVGQGCEELVGCGLVSGNHSLLVMNSSRPGRPLESESVGRSVSRRDRPPGTEDGP